MDDFPGTEEADRFRHIRIPDGSENVVISGPGFLLCCHIFRQIRDDITFGLEFTGVKRNTACGLWPERCGVVDIVGAKAGAFDFLHGQILGELIDDGADHLEVRKLIGIERLSLIIRKNPGIDMQGKICLIPFAALVPFRLVVHHLLQQFLQAGVLFFHIQFVVV